MSVTIFKDELNLTVRRGICKDFPFPCGLMAIDPHNIGVVGFQSEPLLHGLVVSFLLTDHLT